jgi:hypothetical protein
MPEHSDKPAFRANNQLKFLCEFMKILYQHQEQSSFTATHLPCPCGEHHGCYSQRADGSGLCFSCGKNHPANTRTSAYTPPRPIAPPSPPKPIQIVPDTAIFPTMFGVATSPFWLTFKRITGTTPYGYIGIHNRQQSDIVFWYRNYEGKVLRGKVIRYNPSGFRRCKKENGEKELSIWLGEQGTPTPLWNEELLPLSGNVDVVLLESEKSAAYALEMIRGFLWLATGGTGGANDTKIRAVADLLHGRRVFTMFDNDKAGNEATEATIQRLRKYGVSAYPLRPQELFPTIPEKWDIADVITEGAL